MALCISLHIALISAYCAAAGDPCGTLRYVESTGGECDARFLQFGRMEECEQEGPVVNKECPRGWDVWVGGNNVDHWLVDVE